MNCIEWTPPGPREGFFNRSCFVVNYSRAFWPRDISIVFKATGDGKVPMTEHADTKLNCYQNLITRLFFFEYMLHELTERCNKKRVLAVYVLEVCKSH